MQRAYKLLGGMLAIALVGACNGAKSPDAVATDVATAQKQASAEVADARKDAAKEVDSASAKVDEKTKDLNAASAQGAYDVAIAKAEGDRKVALELCNAQSGEFQKACKDRAEAAYEQAKANAMVAKVSKTN